MLYPTELPGRPRLILAMSAHEMVRPPRLERGTSGSAGQRSIHLSYGRTETSIDNCSHCHGAPGAIRTRDLRFRRPTLYPTELRAHRFRQRNLNLSNLAERVGFEPTRELFAPYPLSRRVP